MMVAMPSCLPAHDGCTSMHTQVLLNGHASNLSYGVSAYVTQDVQLIGTLTVRETLLWTALLRLPGSWSSAQKSARVDQVSAAHSTAQHSTMHPSTAHEQRSTAHDSAAHGQRTSTGEPAINQFCCCAVWLLPAGAPGTGPALSPAPPPGIFKQR